MNLALARYARRAESDLDDIARFTVDKWSREQAARYLAELADRCDFLAANPNLGRRADDLRAHLLKFPQISHWIFYERTKYGILVVRILHKARMPRSKDFR